jgi:hypothetical protein
VISGAFNDKSVDFVGVIIVGSQIVFNLSETLAQRIHQECSFLNNLSVYRTVNCAVS